MKVFLLMIFIFIGPECKVTAQNYKPRFSKEFLNLEVRENTEPKYLLQYISKHVKDRENDKLRYSLDSKGQKICYIGEYDGELRLRIKPDREDQSSYEFKILVSDDFEGGANRAAELTIFLMIRDENDNRPVFQHQSPYLIRISENTAVGTTIGQVKATDADAGKNGIIQYELKDSNQLLPFKLEKITANLILKRPLDYENKTIYTFFVFAKDNGETSLTSQIEVSVNVADAGDNKPYFISQEYEKSIKENIPRGTTIAKIVALDGDKEINNKIHYQIASGDDHNLFHMNPDTGFITVMGGLDRELYDGFDLVVHAYEHNEPSSYSSLNLHISLLDENDNKPYFEQRLYLIKLREDSLNLNTIVSEKLKAIDKDVNLKNNHLRYSIENNEYFKILPDSGVLALKKKIYPSKRRTYQFQVFATETRTNEKYRTSCNITVFIEYKNTYDFATRTSSSLNINSISITCLSTWTLLVVAISRMIL